MPCAGRCAGSVRENGGPLRHRAVVRFGVSVLPLTNRISQTNRSTQAHIWHTTQHRETSPLGVLEEMALVSANQCLRNREV
jgi:hypothetical protein